jgi:glycosyltransferase involved in cell wall biosynthesis
MKIGILCNRFIEWGGGIGFLQLILQGLELSSKKNNITIVLLMPKRESTFFRYFKNSIKIIFNYFFFKKFKTKDIIKDSNIINQLVNSVNIKIKLVRYKHTLSNLEKICIKEDIDVLLPSFENLGVNFSIPWIGYIYDFQHKEMPGFFSEKDVKLRDIDFFDMLSNSKSILVNSMKVKSDINRYFEYKTENIFALPFTPFNNRNGHGSTLGVLSKNKIKGKYFVIANQFWRHKDHLTAFLAFASFCSNNSDYQLVCTGDLSDYRDPSYINMLKDVLISNSIENRVIFTGFLRKVEMLVIIENAICLIQPTLYEGGPGGGAVYDAYAYGFPILLSDIEINDEVIDFGNVIRFEKKNVKDLCDKMQIAILREKVDYSTINAFMLNANEELGNQLYNAILKTCEK